MKRNVFAVIFTAMVLVLLVGCGGKANFKGLETDFTSLATKFYEENQKDKVLGVNEHKITLTMMEDANYDISKFIDKGCEKDSSYALIKLTLNEKREVVGNFQVENHLVCGDYKTGDEK